MMRVLFVHSGNMFGGTERTLEAVAQAPRWTDELEPHFAVCFDGPFTASLRELGVPYSLLGEVRVLRPDLILKARAKLKTAIDEVNPDVVVLTSAWIQAVFGATLRRARVPFVLWVHDLLTGVPWLERIAARQHPALLVCNSVVTQRASTHVFPGSPSVVIRCPLVFQAPAIDRAATRARLQTPESDVVIVNVARMEAYKGQRLLLQALSQLDAATAWTCWIAGGAQRPHEVVYEQSLRDMAIELGIASRVRFLGQQSDVASLLGAADVFCHPHQGVEPFGLAVVEALQAGLPVVATNLGGPAEIVTPACGRLVAAHDAAGLSDALAELMQDPAARQAAASAGVARAIALCEPRARLVEIARALQGVRTRVAA